jgi:hypothetical protein
LRDSLLQASAPPGERWMGDVALRLAHEESLELRSLGVNGIDHLALFPDDGGEPLAYAAMLATAVDAALATDWPEYANEYTATEELRAMERASGAASYAPDATGAAPSDARWLWVIAIALAGVEWRFSRRRRSGAQ